MEALKLFHAAGAGSGEPLNGMSNAAGDAFVQRRRIPTNLVHFDPLRPHRTDPDTTGLRAHREGTRANGEKSDEAIVFGVAADPIPDHSIPINGRQCTVAEADANRIDAVLPFQFLEVERGMERIVLEDSISALRLALGCGW
jgi:hypothetical protein